MASSFNASLLDELMGKNRNAVSGEEIRQPRWDDKEVCRYFTCGFCVNELFTNTRVDLGVCDKIHDEKLRDDYRKSSRHQKMGYEDEYCQFLQTMINDVERRIQRGWERIRMDNEEKEETGMVNNPGYQERAKRIEELTNDINALVAEAESLGNEGNVERAQEATVKMEKLQREKNNLVSQNSSGTQQHKELTVCEICGAFQIKDDAPCRQEEHFSGKMHIGYSKIRSFVEEWERIREQRRQRISEDMSEKRQRSSKYDRVRSSHGSNSHTRRSRDNDDDHHHSSRHSRDRRREPQNDRHASSKERRNRHGESDSSRPTARLHADKRRDGGTRENRTDRSTNGRLSRKSRSRSGSTKQ